MKTAGPENIAEKGESNKEELEQFSLKIEKGWM